MLNLEADKQEHAERREEALTKMRANIERFAATMKENLSADGLSRAAVHTIQEHPWLATGAALGAGFLATQLVRPLLRPSPAQIPPQRVVVELKQPDGSVVSAQPAPQGSVFRDLIVTAATSAFVAARPLLEKVLKEYVAPTAPAPAKESAEAKTA
jgi:hypothetical protein